ncbi:hypothetical protein ACFPRL_29465 [Pseudoclavibacter helvolus]
MRATIVLPRRSTWRCANGASAASIASAILASSPDTEGMSQSILVSSVEGRVRSMVSALAKEDMRSSLSPPIDRQAVPARAHRWVAWSA